MVLPKYENNTMMDVASFVAATGLSDLIRTRKPYVMKDYKKFSLEKIHCVAQAMLNVEPPTILKEACDMMRLYYRIDMQRSEVATCIIRVIDAITVSDKETDAIEALLSLADIATLPALMGGDDNGQGQ